MSRKIGIKIKCEVCTNNTPTETIKPTPGGKKRLWVNCENCESQMLVVVQKQLGGGSTAFQYMVLEVNISEYGKTIIDKAEEKIRAQKAAVNTNPELEQMKLNL